jgi:hypothetical protein
VDKDGYAVLKNLKPAYYCGRAFKTKTKNTAMFVAAYETMEVPLIYEGPEAEGA